MTFGFITDVHHGTHGKDQVARLTPFINAAIARKPDFIIQCGDFCCAKGGIGTAKDFLAEWNRFPGVKRHVIGNHDCDFQSKAELLEAWQIPHPYYSFDAGGFHFIVLDRNHFIDDEGKMVSYANGNWYPIIALPSPGYSGSLGIQKAGHCRHRSEPPEGRRAPRLHTAGHRGGQKIPRRSWPL